MSDVVSYSSGLTAELKKDAGCYLDSSGFNLLSNGDFLREKDGIYTNANNSWSPKNSPLTIQGIYQIEKPFVFWKNKLLCRNSEIGVALHWNSVAKGGASAFKMQGLILPKEKIFSSSSHREYHFDHTFNPGEIVGSLTLKLCLYIKEPASVRMSGEEHLVNVKGYCISPPLEQLEYIFEDCREFPIEEVSDPNAPLWWLHIANDIEDPEIERFEKSNVCVYLNNAYPGYSIAAKSDGLIMIHTEIIATAYLLLIKYLLNHSACQNYVNKLASGDETGEFDENSIVGVVASFIRNTDIHINEPDEHVLLEAILRNMRLRLA